jgi:hypothetical protein
MCKKIVTEKKERQIHVSEIKDTGFVFAIFNNKWHLLVKGNTGTWPYCFVGLEQPMGDPKCQSASFSEAVKNATDITPHVYYSDTFEEFSQRISEPAF